MQRSKRKQMTGSSYGRAAVELARLHASHQLLGAPMQAYWHRLFRPSWTKNEEGAKGVVGKHPRCTAHMLEQSCAAGQAGCTAAWLANTPQCWQLGSMLAYILPFTSPAFPALPLHKLSTKVPHIWGRRRTYL